MGYCSKCCVFSPLYPWAVMAQIQSLLDILFLGKDPEGWGRLAGLCGEVFLCCVDRNSWMESWFIHLDSRHANGVGFSMRSKAPTSTFEDILVNSSDEAVWVCQTKSDFTPPLETGASVDLWFNGLMAVSEVLQFSELLQVHWWVRPHRPILSH